VRQGGARTGLCVAALVLLVAALAVWALGVGSLSLTPGQIWAALWSDALTREALVMRTVRLPRVLAAIATGAALAVAGAMMQALTRNPLAEPGLLGISAGAAFAVVVVSVVTGVAPRAVLVQAAMAGAALAAAGVWALAAAGRSGGSPLRLVLAGVVMAGALSAATAALLLYDQATLDSTRVWSAGSLAGVQMAGVVTLAPWLGAGLLVALASLRQVGILELGDETAQSLGLNPWRWRLAGASGVVMLAGGAVALAGPVAFLGLVVPHALRLLTGGGYRLIVPLCLPAGAALALLADTLPRAVSGRDVPLGITVALLGAPVFLAIVRRRTGPGRG